MAIMVSAIDLLGGQLIRLWSAVAEFLYLVQQTIFAVVTPPIRYKDVIRQFYFVGNESAPIIAFCVSFAAIVTITEAAFHMRIVIHDDSMVPGFAALLILRELGSVISLLLVTSRVGAGIAAEVGSMNITEQIDALRMLGISPIRFLVVPRLLACILGGICLTAIANTVCLTGAMLVSMDLLGSGPGMFLMAMRRFVHFQDWIFAMIKGGVFGAVIPIISCYYGFRCKAGAEGVGAATTSAVVASSVAIIVLDFILTWVLSHFY